jgi:hypothetical protein
MLFCDQLVTQSRMTSDEEFEETYPQLAIEQIVQDVASGERSPNAFHARDVAKREWDERNRKPKFSSPTAERWYGK